MSSDLLLSLAGSAVVLAAPGPTNALLAAMGALADRDAGRRIGRLVAAVVLGYAASMTLLRAVGPVVVDRLPEAAPVVRLLLAGWLVYLGCCLWRRPPEGSPAGVGPREVFLATLLNPKGAVFALVLWPEGQGGGALALWIAGLFGLIVAVSAAWAEAGRRLGGLDGHHGGRVARAGAVVVIGFAGVVGAGAVATLARLVAGSG